MSNASPPLSGPLSYSDDVASLSEPRLKASKDGVQLLIPPPPRWLVVCLLISFGITLPLFLAADAIVLAKLPQTWRFIQEGRRSWADLLAFVFALIPLVTMTGLMGLALPKTLAMLSRVPRKLELSNNRFVYIEPGIWRARRREWKTESVQSVKVSCPAVPSLGGKYVFELSAGPLRFAFSASDKHFGEAVGDAIRAVLHLPVGGVSASF
jgi:hypothetical protein